MISAQERTTLRKNIERYEGRISHMYLDSRGFVTVGVGHLLATAGDAKKLPFEHVGGDAVDDAMIEQEYNALKEQPGNRIAHFYKPFTQLRLSDEAIDALTDKHIDTFYSELKRIYNDFDDFPSEAKLATFDLIFNLGMTKLKNRWPNFNACVASKDWRSAADNSRRRGISDERNAYVRDLLIQASSIA